MRRSPLPLLLAACLAAGAALCRPPTLRWDVERPRAATMDWQGWHGETLTLQPRFLDYGSPVSLAGAMATGYWQTNGMGSAWWSSPAAVVTSDPGRVSWTFAPTNDVGAASYTYFIGVSVAAGSAYRATGRLTLKGSPGRAAAMLPPPEVFAGLQAVSNALAQALQDETQDRAAAVAAEALAREQADAAEALLRTSADVETRTLIQESTNGVVAAAERVTAPDCGSWVAVEEGTSWLYVTESTVVTNGVVMRVDALLSNGTWFLNAGDYFFTGSWVDGEWIGTAAWPGSEWGLTLYIAPANGTAEVQSLEMQDGGLLGTLPMPAMLEPADQMTEGGPATLLWDTSSFLVTNRQAQATVGRAALEAGSTNLAHEAKLDPHAQYMTQSEVDLTIGTHFRACYSPSLTLPAGMWGMVEGLTPLSNYADGGYNEFSCFRFKFDASGVLGGYVFPPTNHAANVLVLTVPVFALANPGKVARVRVDVCDVAASPTLDTGSPTLASLSTAGLYTLLVTNQFAALTATSRPQIRVVMPADATGPTNYCYVMSHQLRAKWVAP